MPALFYSPIYAFVLPRLFFTCFPVSFSPHLSLPSFLGPFHCLVNFFLLCNFLIPCYLPPLISNSPPSDPDLKQHFAHLVSTQILAIKYILVSDINLVRAARVDVSEL
jgi:hypothetical protein